MLSETTRALVLEALANLKTAIFDIRARYPTARHTDIVERIDAAVAEVSAAEATPQPDWSQAPEWANWWAVEPGGNAGWYEYEPEINNDEWYPGDVSYATSDGWWSAGQVDIPLGIDWRLLKQRRPDSAQAKGGDDGN